MTLGDEDGSPPRVTGTVRAILLCYVFATLFPALFSFSNASQQYNGSSLHKYSSALLAALWLISGTLAVVGFVFSQVYYRRPRGLSMRDHLRQPTVVLFYIWIPILSVLEGIVSVERPNESQLSVWVAIAVTAITSLNNGQG